MHDDARRRKTTLRSRHLIYARLLPRGAGNPNGIPVADTPAPERGLNPIAGRLQIEKMRNRESQNRDLRFQPRIFKPLFI